MSSKLDKTKKIFPSQQLSLVEPLESAAKAKKKKTTLMIALFLCIGLSTIFAAYRTINRIISEKKYQKIKINLDLPDLKINSSNRVDLDASINPLIQDNDSLWSFYVETLPATSQSFSWSRNRDQMFLESNPVNTVSQLLKKENAVDSLAKNNLPEGAQIKENQIAKDNYFEYQSIVTVPGKQIFIVIKTSGGTNLEKSKSLIPLLVEKIYWSVIKI
ncbi:MAG: hypothetical protein WC841_03280 [Candidatus Shapirobacteria bacterium]|jgi:hypothetical protein